MASYAHARSLSSPSCSTSFAAACFTSSNAGLQCAHSRVHFSTTISRGVHSRFRSTRSRVGFLRLEQRFAERKCATRRRAAAGANYGATTAESLQAEKSSPKELVANLLALVEGTDRGAQLGKEEQANVAELLGRLEEFCIPEPLKSPLIFGDWNVSYSSNPTSPGGGYRSWLGRIIFRTKAMIQTITAPNIVVNVLQFALFGFVLGEVMLQGKLKPLDSKTVQVDFEPPSLRLGPFKFQYGKVSAVKLAIIYLDETLRLGRGSRGTVFVFTRQ